MVIISTKYVNLGAKNTKYENGLNCPKQSRANNQIFEFPQALPSGTPSAKGVYLTVYPSSCPEMDKVCVVEG